MPIESNIIKNNSPGNPAGSGRVSSGRQTRATGISSVPVSGSSISEGQILKGEITDIRGKSVTISLSDNSVITGTMRDISNLYIGQTTAFRVTGISPRLITLESLLGDISNQENLAIRKALDEAELPVSDRNILIVRELLSNGMSINKETITDMIRQTSALGNISPGTIVLMNKYGIPATQALARQFENYRNGNSSLIRDIDALSESLPVLLEELSANADAAPVAEFGSRLMSILAKHIADNPKPQLTADLSTFSAPERNELTAYINEAAALNTDATYNKEAVTDITAAITNGTASADVVWNTINNLSSDFLQLPEAYSKLTAQADYLHFNNNYLTCFLDQDSRNELADMLKPVISDAAILNNVRTGNISAEAIFTSINNSILSSDAYASADLFASKSFMQLFKKVIHSSWTLSSRELANTENIGSHYSQLADELMKITNLIRDNLSGTTSASLTKQASGMNDNLNFMNELNNYFQYVQLPVRFQDQTAHGDLYVYTKKDELKRHPDKVSVLLHLSFEHLGDLDINITKDKSRIDSTFSCPDSETVQLLKTNMGMLTDVLSENGYIFSANVQEAKPKQDIVTEFINRTIAPDGHTPTQGSLNRYAFDLRA